MTNLIKDKDFLKFVGEARKNKNIVACILFGSYAKGTQKKTSDVDICIFRKQNTSVNDFLKIYNLAEPNYDILFFDNLTDMIKFRVFSEGKVLVLNDDKEFSKIKRKFLHIYRDNFPYYERNMQRMIANV